MKKRILFVEDQNSNIEIIYESITNINNFSVKLQEVIKKR